MTAKMGEKKFLGYGMKRYGMNQKMTRHNINYSILLLKTIKRGNMKCRNLILRQNILGSILPENGTMGMSMTSIMIMKERFSFRIIIIIGKKG